jgi:hypothetical protein
MSNNVSTKKKHNNNNNNDKRKSLIDTILEYESLVVFGGFGCAILGTIIFTGIFQAGPAQRENLLFNAAGAIFMGVGFIYIIVTFMGSELEIYGKKIDIGMIIYVAIVLFVMFVLGN